MTDLEHLVRDALAFHAGGAPDAERLLHEVHERAARERRRSWSAVVLAAAAGTAVVVAVAAQAPGADPMPDTGQVAGAEQGQDTEAASGADATAPGPTSTDAVPAGLQPVSFHGVEVLVPASWSINAIRCGSTPTQDTVVIEDGSPQAACLQAQPPGLTVLRLAPLGEPFDGAAGFATDTTTVSGQPARRGVGTLDRANGGQQWEVEIAVLVLPGPGVLVTVESPDPTYAQELLDSVRIVDVDSVGCRDRVPPLEPRPGDSRSGAADRLVPGAPTSAAICRYVGDWLARSAAVPRDDVGQLVTILNALPVGVSTPGPGFFVTPESCADDPARVFVVQFAEADGTASDVHVNLDGCRDIAATNGVRTTKLDGPLVDFLIGAVGYDGGFPDPSELS